MVTDSDILNIGPCNKTLVLRLLSTFTYPKLLNENKIKKECL